MSNSFLFANAIAQIGIHKWNYNILTPLPIPIILWSQDSGDAVFLIRLTIRMALGDGEFTNIRNGVSGDFRTQFVFSFQSKFPVNKPCNHSDIHNLGKERKRYERDDDNWNRDIGISSI